MQGDSWTFTDDDRARLQPLLEKAMRVANHAIEHIGRMVSNVDDFIEILQGCSEEIAERLREEILQQVDRGEWSARGISTRTEMDITVRVSARDSVEQPNANLFKLSIQPYSRLS